MTEERLETIINGMVFSFKTAENAACDLIEIMGRAIDAITAAYEIKCETIHKKTQEGN